jgi:hypothetical protein
VAGEEGGSVVRMWKDQETDREYDGEISQLTKAV